MKRSFALLFGAGVFLAACEPAGDAVDTTSNDPNMPQPPVAKKVAHPMETHGDVRQDDYYWMRLSDEQKEASDSARDGQTQDVLDYLNAENDYSDAMLAHTEGLQETLYTEMTGRLKQNDESLPYQRRGYWYYSRYEEGQDYPLICRKQGSLEAEEQIMLNGPEMGAGLAYFSLGGSSVSTNNNLLAYSTDTQSRRRYNIEFKNLTTGEKLPDYIENTTGGITWAGDNKTVFYTRRDEETLRAYRIYKHVLGTDPASDELVFEETDETFSCFVYKTKSDDYLIIGSSQTLSTEYRFLDANTPNGEWKVIQPRQRDLEYSVSHYGDDFYIISNRDGASNFRLDKTPVSNPGMDNWTEVLPHRDNVFLEGIEIFKDYLVVDERKDGLKQLRIKKWDGSEDYYMEFPDKAYSAGTAYNPEFDSPTLRYSYVAMNRPRATIDYTFATREREVKKQDEVIDENFSPDNYISDRIMAPARDGVEVPVSIVYHKNTPKDGSAPILVYAYGSYGSTMDPYFSIARLSLLDRGFVFALAHVRGGQEMGRQWYENGKLLNKKNTFTDFIDVSEHLVEQKYAAADKVFAMGGSAGGLLMGAIVNMRPDMWAGVVAAVPFVDVVTTMLDETIPLTTFEWDEWGDPREKEYYDYMKSYSPYDNVEAKDYPNMLVTTGYWDSQVQYWEPAKWVALMRELKTDNNALLMTCDMEAGHGGASGRLKRYKETAKEYAFMLDLAGVSE